MKISFKKLYKKDLIIYDFTSLNFAKKIFNCDYEIYYNRFESINFFIFLKTIFKFDYLTKKITYNNFKDFYKKLFFQTVNPKIVYTCIDNNPSFYKLKYIYPEAIYISDQNGMRNEDFFNYAKKFKKLNRYKLKCDFFFLFGLDYYKKISKVIDAKFIISGNTLNNFYPKKKFKIKNKSLLYLSSGFAFNHFQKDVDVIKNLLIFCKKYSYKLSILGRPQNKLNIKFNEIFKKENINILESKNKKDSYNYIHKHSIVAFRHTTLGYEALARGIKIASFGHNYINYTYNYKKSGPFWCSNKYNDIENLLKKLISLSPNEWKKIYKKYSKKIIYFDSDNKKKYKLIRYYLKKNNY